MQQTLKIVVKHISAVIVPFFCSDGVYTCRLGTEVSYYTPEVTIVVEELHYVKVYFVVFTIHKSLQNSDGVYKRVRRS
jgi:hypothetical protein